MRKLIAFFFLLACAATLHAQYDEYDNRPVKPFVLPGKGKINVETLNKKIDFNMDISQLNVAELRVLRNAIPARKGYLFSNAELRGVFNTTSWYEKLCWEKFDWDTDDTAPVTYTAKETAFMNRLQAREKELLKNNFQSSEGIVNLDNLVNPYQMDKINPAMRAMLAKQGFGIVETNEEQLFQIYEANDYSMFPSFVTTDLYLQLYHLFFDTMLRKVEETTLGKKMADLNLFLYKEMMGRAANTKNKDIKAAAEWDAAFFAVAQALFTDGPLPEVAPQLMAMAQDELTKCKASENDMSEFLEQPNVQFPYSLFRPRGHYTRSEMCQRYFRGMMWLQTVPFRTDFPHHMLRAAVIADAVANNASLLAEYKSVDEVVAYLMGTPDNITILQVADVMQKGGYTLEKLAAKKKTLQAFADEVDAVAEKQIRIRPAFERSGRNKVNFMPQRYMPDAEVLQEMCDYENEVTKRDVPKGLDVMAAFGSSAAERILLQELKEGERWEKYVPNLNKMKDTMKGADWRTSIATRWMDVLNTLNNSKDNRYPYFMNTQAWDKKNLNATVASWAELKHYAILYAKQPFAAECGDGSLPAPMVKGYVEPNVGFWRKAVSLFDDTQALFRRNGLLTEDISNVCDPMREEAEFLLKVSEKELAGTPLDAGEYDHIRYIGATFENLSLGLLKEPDQYLSGWSDVQGTDKSMAIVADVYTANGFNNPEQSVLFEGVGPANELYVVVEIDGYLYLMRGAVFSYREFKRPIDEQRMTDEEWQQYLQQYPETGKPSWMKEIIIPSGEKPVPNERIFYSTGC